MKNIRRLDISITRRPASYRGPRSSEDWTDTFDELIRDLTELASQWNTGVIKLFTTLPDGSDDSTVDAFINGIDGRTVYVDSSLTANSTILTYWHETRERPKTVKEALEDIYSYLDDQISNIQADVVAASGGLTSDQKAAIGANIFDNTKTSTATSLDGKSERNRVNLIQVASDLYGASASLDNDGVANLTYSVQQMLGALLAAHGGNWADDITLTHSGITVTQVDIDSSATITDSYAGIPSTTEDDLNQIRTQIKTYAGTASWTTAMPALYTGGPDSLRDLLASTAGSAAKSASNPWGYQYDDIAGLVGILDAISGFTGMIDFADATPDFPSNYFLTDGRSLAYAMGDVDNVLHWAATPGEVLNSEQFRRFEFGIIHQSGEVITHNKGAWPQIEVVQISPDPLVSGQLPFAVKHNSLNEFELWFMDRNDHTLYSGVVSSGIIVCTW